MAANEWRDGCWLNSEGTWTYEGVGLWKTNSTGWWFEDTAGWYASGCWQKINERWYYFEDTGYMAASRYVDGYWLNSEGVYVP